MKNLVKILIVIISINAFGQAKIVKNDNPLQITVEMQDGERVTFKKILEVDTSKFDKDHFQNQIEGKELTSIVVGRKKGLGMKTKSSYGLDYDQQLMVYGEDVYFLTPSLIYKRPTLTRDKKDLVQKMRKNQLANK